MPTTDNFISGGKTIQAELFAPSGTPNGGVIVIVYGTFGTISPWGSGIRAYADALSQKGFVAIIPDYFASTSTKPGFTDFNEIGLHRNTWQATIADAISHAKTLLSIQASRVGLLLSIQASRVGLLGFSLGGHLCLRVRETASVLVEFFAPELDGLGTTPKPTLKAQIHHGLADKIVPYHPNAENINIILQKEGASVELFSYPGADHGFIKNNPDDLNARKDSMERTLAFFEKYL